MDAIEVSVAGQLLCNFVDKKIPGRGPKTLLTVMKRSFANLKGVIMQHSRLPRARHAGSVAFQDEAQR